MSNMIATACGWLARTFLVGIACIVLFFGQSIRCNLTANPGLFVLAAILWFTLWFSTSFLLRHKVGRSAAILCPVLLLGITIVSWMPGTAEGLHRRAQSKDNDNLEDAKEATTVTAHEIPCDRSNFTSLVAFKKDNVTGQRVTNLFYSSRDDRIHCFTRPGFDPLSGARLREITPGVLEDIATQPAPKIESAQTVPLTPYTEPGPAPAAKAPEPIVAAASPTPGPSPIVMPPIMQVQMVEATPVPTSATLNSDKPTESQQSRYIRTRYGEMISVTTTEFALEEARQRGSIGAVLAQALMSSDGQVIVPAGTAVNLYFNVTRAGLLIRRIEMATPSGFNIRAGISLADMLLTRENPRTVRMAGGAAIGAGLGALLGRSIDKRRGTLIGAGIGAAAGSGVGAATERRTVIPAQTIQMRLQGSISVPQ